jgi:hypothetical protein
VKPRHTRFHRTNHTAYIITPTNRITYTRQIIIVPSSVENTNHYLYRTR